MAKAKNSKAKNSKAKNGKSAEPSALSVLAGMVADLSTRLGRIEKAIKQQPWARSRD